MPLKRNDCCSQCIVLLKSAQKCLWLKWHKWAEKCPFRSIGLSRQKQATAAKRGAGGQNGRCPKRSQKDDLAHMGQRGRKLGAADMSLGEAFSAPKGRRAKADYSHPRPWAKPTMVDFAHGRGRLRRSRNRPPNQNMY